MAKIQKIDKIPDEVREKAGFRGKERSEETRRIGAMQVGDVLRFEFDGNSLEEQRTRKKAEGWRRRKRKEGLDYIICQREDVLYIERVK